MSATLHVGIIAGTRPEAIKIAPLVHCLRSDHRMRTTLIATGQHPVMLDQVLAAFDITPDITLGLHRHSASLARLNGAAITELDEVLATSDIDVVVVQGDTTSAFAGAFAAYLRGIPVVHLEAGLRTNDLRNPFPEEGNRRMIARLAALHLAATDANRRNLIAEGVDGRDILVIGNTVIDALFDITRRRPTFSTEVLRSLEAETRKIVVVTAHRRESWGEPMVQIATAVRTIAARDDVMVVWPLHANPAVRAAVEPVVGDLGNVLLLGPLDYPDFSHLLHVADLVLTDSGGVQEECPAVGTPVVVLRTATERFEALECGAATLAGTDPVVIVALAERRLDSIDAPITCSPYGDGHAAQRAVDAIASHFLGAERPSDFTPPVSAGRSALDVETGGLRPTARFRSREMCVSRSAVSMPGS